MKKWVLVVDDEPELRDLIASLIEMNYGEDVRIVEAKDGIEATTRLRFQAFNCIITDIRMPKKDGWSFLDDLKKSAFNQNTPVVVVSAFIPNDDKRAKEHTVLHKPFESQDLIQILDKEFKLGRTDQRIGADLLNTFISSTIEFLEKSANLKATQKEPGTKGRGDDLWGDYHYFAHIRVGKRRNTFVFSFSEPLLKYLSSLDAFKSLVEEKLLAAAAKAVMNFSVKAMRDDGITIESHYIVNADARKSAEGNAGINLPIQTDQGDFNILAIWEKSR